MQRGVKNLKAKSFQKFSLNFTNIKGTSTDI